MNNKYKIEEEFPDGDVGPYVFRKHGIPRVTVDEVNLQCLTNNISLFPSNDSIYNKRLKAIYLVQEGSNGPF